MSIGAFGENFPYSNFHDLNMDWVIKIAKDFLDQYTHLQETIANGEESLTNTTTEGLEQLQTKADTLETLLQQWYETHSEDIANQLAEAIAQYRQTANMITQESIASIPSDYTDLTTNVDCIRNILRRIAGSKPLKVDVGYYYILNGAQIGEKVAGDIANNQCCFTACSPGDVFLINAEGGDTTRAYAFADANGNIIARADANTAYSHRMLVAPPGSVAFYSDNIALPGNVPLANYYILYGNPILNTYNNNIDAIRNAFEYVTNALPLQIHPGYYDMTGTTLTNRAVNGDPANNLCCVSACSPGDAFIISGKGGTTARLWAFADANHNIIARAAEGQQLNGELCIAPQNAAYFYSNGLISSGVPYYVLKNEISMRNNSDSPTPIIFFINELVSPNSGFSNRQMIDTNIDAEDITIMVRVDVTANSVIFLGSVDILGTEHASHVQYDFSNKTIRIYKNGTGNSIPDTIIHTVDFSSLGNFLSAQVYIGRRDRALWVAIENYATGEKVSYTVQDSLNNYKYPAGWLADKLTYGTISGAATFHRITATTKVEPYIAFIGDSITEGYGIPYEDSWAYKVGNVLGNFLCMGRSGGTTTTAQEQVNDILSKIKPKFVAICIGTNGGITTERLTDLIQSIKNIGAFPILCRIPMLENAQTTNTINSIISAQNIPVAGFDHATAINDEQNPALFQSDRIHPNADGADAIATQFMENIGMLFVR